MSPSPGQVHDARGNIVGHFEYISTVDAARPQIFTSAEARDSAWRQMQPTPCTCEGIEVTLEADGWSGAWDARACLDHGFIVAKLSPLDYEDDLWPLSGKKRIP
jgi:hypothetical protein